MSKPDIWMPIIIGKYLADTRHLSCEQHGAYLLLLMSAWPRGGSLPDDDEQLARMTATTPVGWRRLRPVIAPFFTIAEGQWRQKRLDVELTAAADRTAKATAKAEAAAAARWEKERQKNATSNAPSNAQASKQKCLEETSVPVSKNKSSSNPLSTSSTMPGFDAFWKAYPAKHRRVAKAKCLQAWAREKLEVVASEIVANVQAMTQTQQWQEGYEPAPLKYLKERRWEDGMPASGLRAVAM